MYKIKQFFRNIKRVLDFLPLIWKHRDYDYRYSINLFKYSLQRQADFFETDETFSADAKQYASRIRTAIRLMDKVYNEEYGTEYLDLIERLYGKTEYKFIKIEGTDYYSMEVKNELAVDEKHQEEINKVKREMMKYCDDKQERAHGLLWRFVSHNIRDWWD
jgi:hypothetical protein